MKVIKATQQMLETRTLVLGFQGENERTQVRIDCAPFFEEYPDATPSLAIKPPLGDVYLIMVDRDGDEVVWNILSSDLVFDGDGELQLTFTKSNVICKTIIGNIRVKRSLQISGDAPSPIESWIDRANEKLAAVDASITAIDRMDAVAVGLPAGVDPTAELQDVDNHKRLVFGIPESAHSAGTMDYEQLENHPSINGTVLFGDKTSVDLGIVSENTETGWAENPLYVPKRGEICLFTDSQRIKIGDGTVSVVDLPYINGAESDTIMDILTKHISDTVVHVTQADRDYWNAKLNYTLDGENLTFTRG